MVFALLVAAGAWYVTETTVDSSCSQVFTPGANIDHAWRLVLFASLGGLVLVWLVHRRKRLLTALLLFEAVTLSLAISLVALDSGTFRNRVNCHNAGQGISYDTHHVASLEVWWAVPLVCLLLLTVSVWWKPGRVRAAVIPAAEPALLALDGRRRKTLIAILIALGVSLLAAAVALSMALSSSRGAGYKELGPPLPDSGVSQIAFSPDGRLLASANDQDVRIWDLRAKRELGKPYPCSLPILFSPDGRLVCQAGNWANNSNNGPHDTWTIQFWKPGPARKLVNAIRGHGVVSTIAVSPDGSDLATLTDDNRVRLWNLRTHRLVGHPLRDTFSQDFHNTLAFSPNGRLLAIGMELVIALWDMRAHKPFSRPLTFQAGVIPTGPGLAFSPNSHLLAYVEGGNANGYAGQGTPVSLRLWNVRTQTHAGPPLTFCPSSMGLAFRPTGHLLATACGGAVRFWNLRNDKQAGPPLETSNVQDLVFSKDGRTLATAGSDNTVRLWKVANRAAASRRG
jgi:hypothetical protein